MNSLPQEIRNKIPTPPTLKKLPQPIQEKIMAVVKNGSLSLAQKRSQLEAIYDALTPDQKKLVPLWAKLRECPKLFCRMKYDQCQTV
ncbi:unnamed protein product [Gongylonema pulchrum]|uniref:DUF438 domain-containing protein n=1 Tax=Gongylonema pulchrum TaxID=637853 RepID=A0A183CWK5_9BILA|nr:unnamed protein product [Gongylonema pulchrum]